MLNSQVLTRKSKRQMTTLSLWDEKLEEVVSLSNQLLEAHKELAALMNRPSFGRLDIRAQAIKALTERIDALSERLAAV